MSWSFRVVLLLPFPFYLGVFLSREMASGFFTLGVLHSWGSVQLGLEHPLLPFFSPGTDSFSTLA